MQEVLELQLVDGYRGLAPLGGWHQPKTDTFSKSSPKGLRQSADRFVRK